VKSLGPTLLLLHCALAGVVEGQTEPRGSPRPASTRQDAPGRAEEKKPETKAEKKQEKGQEEPGGGAPSKGAEGGQGESTDEQEVEDPLADKYKVDEDVDLDEHDKGKTGVDEVSLADLEPSFLERWLRLGKLRVRNRFEYYYRKFESKGFSDQGVEVVPPGTNRDNEFRYLFELETHGLGHDQINSYVSFDWRADMDRDTVPSPHTNIVDAFEYSRLSRLNSLWVEAVDVADHVRIRVGRQSTVEVYPVLFDGAHVVVDRFRLFRMPTEFRIFAGRMATFYSDLRDEFVAGGGLLLRPTPELAFEAREFYYAKNRLELEARWAPLEGFSLLGMYGLFQADPRDARIEAGYSIDSVGFDVTAGYYERYANSFRLDYFTDQPKQNFDRDYLRLTQLAPYGEAYVRLSQQVLPDNLVIGGEYINHRLRNRNDEGRYNASFYQVNGFADLRLGPGRVRTEIRYYHADRKPFPYLVPGFPSTIQPAVVGENDHTEYHLNGSFDFGTTGWSVYGGMVWHRLNYSDALASVKDEEGVDYMVEVQGQITRNLAILLRYEYMRDMTFFVPYFKRMDTFSCILDVTL
jgi:hypothetical protein